jgi:catechol-2,3-dioxygenase
MTPSSTHLEKTRAGRIDPRTALGPVRLTVGDLERSRAFYERAIGLRASELDDGTLALGVPGGAEVMRKE